MTPEKQAKLKALREQLKALTPEQRQVLASKAIIATIDGRSLSLHNTMLVYLQCRDHIPTIVGGYQQWRRASKTVKKGEHGFTIWFPVGERDEDGELLSAEKFYTATVFDVTQTEDLEPALTALPA